MKWGRRFRYMLQRGITVISLLFLSGCVRPAPERSFTTAELLVEPSDVPRGWQVIIGPSESHDHIGSGSRIAFMTTESQIPNAEHYVYSYQSVSRAKTVFGTFFTDPPGMPPPEWTYQSPVADQSSFACWRTTAGEEHCEWAGRYEEYIVTFGAWLTPGQVSLEDMKQVVRAIDERMAEYLVKSLDNSDR